MADSKFNNTVESLFHGMDSFLTTKTVVGDAVRIDENTIILPLVEVTFGVGAGAFEGEKKNNAGGGLGGKISPTSVLVLQNGSSKVINVREQDGFSKIIDMVPDIVNKFGKGSKKDKESNKEEDKSKEEIITDEAK